MRVIRPVEHADIAALMQLAGKTGGGFNLATGKMKRRWRPALNALKNLVRRAPKAASKGMYSF